MKLLGNKIIIETIPETTPSGIIIPNNDRVFDAWRKGTVKAVGTGIKPECTVEVGDMVLFQFGFEKLDASSLNRLSGLEVFVPVLGELLIGSPESLFAIIENQNGKSKKKK